jgi:hypothetical protein
MYPSQLTVLHFSKYVVTYYRIRREFGVLLFFLQNVGNITFYRDYAQFTIGKHEK